MSATPGSPIVLVLTTLAAEADAPAFARTLIEEQLAACVSVLPPMISVYRWNGVIEQGREQQLIIKTTAAQVEALTARFRTLHPYELPEFVVVRPESAAPRYLAWVQESVSARESDPGPT